MARIWVMKSVHVSRSRYGTKFNKTAFCIQKDDLTLTGNFLCTNGQAYRLSPSQREIVKVLMLAPGLVSKDALIECVYPNPDYEPESAYNTITQFMIRIRLVLDHLGWQLITRHTRGYELVKPLQQTNAA